MQHDWHHDAQLGLTFPTSRRRSAAAAARASTARPSTARTMRSATTDLRMHASLFPLHAERFPGVLQLREAHMHDYPRPGRVRAGDPLRRRRPTGSRSTRSYPPDPLAPSGAGRRDWGACALHGVPWPTPAGLLRREIPAGMPGFDGRGGGARHGWVRRMQCLRRGWKGRRHA